MFIAYCRVSTEEDQTVANQIYSLKAAGKEFSIAITDEGVSGAKPLSKRPGFQRLLKLVKAGDTILITAQDRIGRNRETFNEIRNLTQKGVKIFSLRELELRAETADEQLVLGMRCEIAIYERNIISERTKQALARLKSEGVKLGKRANQELHKRVKELAAQGMAKAQIAQVAGCSRATVYNILSAE